MLCGWYFKHVAKFPLVERKLPPNCRQIAAFQLVNLIKKIILEPPTPTEAALVGIAH